MCIRDRYIITPSITYIQMANNLRIDLEIEDLKMGTLAQYYDYVIRKYGIDPSEYGTPRPYIKTDPRLEMYIYSDECIADVSDYFDRAIAGGQIDYSCLLYTSYFSFCSRRSRSMARIRRDCAL